VAAESGVNVSPLTVAFDVLRRPTDDGYGGGMTNDLARIAEQQRRLTFAGFDENTAWQLGADLRRRAAERGVGVTIEIRLRGETVFLHAMAGTTPANADWARRKRTVVELLHRPSYAVGLEDGDAGRSSLDAMGFSAREVATHGGSFPIVVDGVGCVGVVTVSGLPQREDHELVVEALAALRGIDGGELRLDPAP
jgi:uncharacterized protein (UPF0303 family)